MKRAFLYCLLFLTGLILGFYLLSDLNKARLSLRILGAHETNQAAFPMVKDIILYNEFKKYDTLESLPNETKASLVAYRNRNLPAKPYNSIYDFYANAGSEISGLDLLAINEFESLWSSEKYLIICSSNYGGFCGIESFEFIEIKNDTLIHEASIGNTTNSSIFDLAIYIRFLDNIVGWSEEYEKINKSPASLFE